MRRYATKLVTKLLHSYKKQMHPAEPGPLYSLVHFLASMVVAMRYYAPAVALEMQACVLPEMYAGVEYRNLQMMLLATHVSSFDLLAKDNILEVEEREENSSLLAQRRHSVAFFKLACAGDAQEHDLVDVVRMRRKDHVWARLLNSMTLAERKDVELPRLSWSTVMEASGLYALPEDLVLGGWIKGRKPGSSLLEVCVSKLREDSFYLEVSLGWCGGDGFDWLNPCLKNGFLQDFLECSYKAYSHLLHPLTLTRSSPSLSKSSSPMTQQKEMP